MAIFYFAQRAPKLRYYGDVIHSFYWKSAVEHDGGVKMRDSVPSPRYSSVCNVLRQWKTSLIPTYRVYRLYNAQCRRSLARFPVVVTNVQCCICRQLNNKPKVGVADAPYLQ